MASTFKTVIVILASLQLTQQASLPNDFFGNKNVFDPLTFHPSFSSPSVANSKETSQHEPVRNEELKSLNIERGSVSNFRSKRELNHDLDMDAEIISSDPKMLSYGKSMPMATEDDDDAHKDENISGNKDADTEKSDLLEVVEGKPKGTNEMLTEEEKLNTYESETEPNTFISQDLDIITSNDASTPKMATHDALEGSFLEKPQLDDSEIRTDPTVNYEVPVPKESDSERDKNLASLEISSQSHDDTHANNNNYNNDAESNELFAIPNLQDQKNTVETHLHDEEDTKSDSLATVEEKKEHRADSEDEITANDMKEDDIDGKELNMSTATSVVVPTTDEVLIAGNSIEKSKGKKEVLSEELFIDNDEAEVNAHLDKDDIDVFSPLQPVDSDNSASMSKLRLADNSSTDKEEGSGGIEDDITGSHETAYIHDIKDKNNINNNSLLEQMSPRTNNMHINIDSVDKTIQMKNKENEDESPISDPTLVASNIHNSSTVLIPPEEGKDDESPIPAPTENSNVDLSQTYDPNTIVNPFNIDSASEFSKYIGKALGIIDNFEGTTEKEELEGSGQSIVFQDNENDTDSLEDGGMIRFNPHGKLTDEKQEGYSETTTNMDDEEKAVTELPMVTKHHTVQLNSPAIVSSDDDALITQTSMSTDSTGDIITESGDSTEDESTPIPPSSELPSEIFLDKPNISDNEKELEEQLTDTSSKPDDDNNLTNNKTVGLIGNTDNTSSSSTGSFIVLGAIMATIVVLLGYSAIKSHRQKQQQRSSRTPQEDDLGTELKEIENLLSEVNGHGPANGMNVEGGKLLNASKERDNNGGTYRKYHDGKEEIGVGSHLSNLPKIDDPDCLSEVKINQSNAVPPDILNQQVANGYGLNSPPNNSLPPNSPSANDKTSLVHGTKLESAKIKMFIDHDSIPKTPIVIVKRGPNNVEM